MARPILSKAMRDLLSAGLHESEEDKAIRAAIHKDWLNLQHAAKEAALRKKSFWFVVRKCHCDGDIVFVRNQVSSVPLMFVPIGPGSLTYFVTEDECYCKKCGQMYNVQAELIQEALTTYLKQIDDEVNAKYVSQSTKDR